MLFTKIIVTNSKYKIINTKLDKQYNNVTKRCQLG